MSRVAAGRRSDRIRTRGGPREGRFGVARSSCRLYRLIDDDITSIEPSGTVQDEV